MFTGLKELVDAGWQFSGITDGYGRARHVAYNTKTGEREQWETPATSLECQCDICTVWRRKGYAPAHPPLASLTQPRHD